MIHLLPHLIYTLLGLTLLPPLFGALLQGLLSLSGSAAVADQQRKRLRAEEPGSRPAEEPALLEEAEEQSTLSLPVVNMTGDFSLLFLFGNVLELNWG